MSTNPEVFIAECLQKKDELLNRYEGRVLYEYLRMQGKNPIYCYFRTMAELSHIAEAFAESGHRYLHFSCHGGDECLILQGSTISYEQFSDLFKSTLTKRRIFMSACGQGNKNFSNTLFNNNGGLLSFLAPLNCPDVKDLTVFWISMYNRLHAFDERSIYGKALRHIVQRLSSTFGIPFYYSHKIDKNYIYEDPTWMDELLEIAASRSS